MTNPTKAQIARWKKDAAIVEKLRKYGGNSLVRDVKGLVRGKGLARKSGGLVRTK